KPGDKIYIGDFILSVGLGDELGADGGLSEDAPELLTHTSAVAPRPPAPPAVPRVESTPPAPPEPPAPPAAARAPQPTPAAPLERVEALEAAPEPRRSPLVATEAGLISGEDALRAVLARLAPDFDVHLASPASLSDPERWTTAQRLIGRAISQLV